MKKNENSESKRFIIVICMSIITLISLKMFMSIDNEMHQISVENALNSEYERVHCCELDNDSIIVVDSVESIEVDTFDTISLKATYYHPTINQCDSNPDETADGTLISKTNHPVIAVSRDMLSRWGGGLNYGDTLYVHESDHKHKLKHFYVIHDTMNQRYSKRCDILSKHGITKFDTHDIKFIIKYKK